MYACACMHVSVCATHFRSLILFFLILLLCLFVFKIGSYCVALADLELTMYVHQASFELRDQASSTSQMLG